MDIGALPALSSDEAKRIVDLVENIKANIQKTYVAKNKVETLALSYQSKIEKLSQKRKLELAPASESGNDADDSLEARKRRRSGQSHAEINTQLQADLHATQAKLKSIEEEHRMLEDKVANRDRSMASDAEELNRLRQENNQIHSLQMRLNALLAEKQALEMRLYRETNESKARLSLGEGATRFLEDQVSRLSSEVTKARFEADTAAADHSSAMRIWNERNEKLANDLAEAKSHANRMEDHIAKIEGENSSLTSAGEKERQYYDEEKAKLLKLVEIQKDLTMEADQRVRDFEEVVNALKEELSEQEKKVSAPQGKLASHAEVLLKNLQDALDARLHLLHQQKEEMERARASEMSMMARQEALSRESEDARWETEQVRKEMERMRNQMKEQTRYNSRLEKQLEISRDAAMAQDSGFGQVPTLRRDSGAVDADIGPRTVIPTHQPLGRPSSDDVASTMDELTQIRLRHQKILLAMREQRSSMR